MKNLNSPPVLKHTITWVEEIHGEAMFCSGMSPLEIESGDFSSVSFGLSLDECIERYTRGDLLTDVTSALITAQLEVYGIVEEGRREGLQEAEDLL